VKFAVVGGGSTYTPELVDGFARLREVLPIDELVLVDPAVDRLRLVGDFAARIFAGYGHPGRVSTTDDLDAAVTDADAVLLQLRVGGQAARHVDETLPLKFGRVGQETTGAGGLAKALRTVPVVLDIAERVRRRAPDAWLIDFTNPVGIVTRALLDAGHRAVGLCNVAITLHRRIAGMLDVAPDRVRLDHVGLNHLTWERAVLLDGVDVLPAELDAHAEQLAAEIEQPAWLLRQLGAIPSYYLRYYYQHDEEVERLAHSESRAEAVSRIEAQLLELYADPTLCTKPDLLAERGGAFYSEAAVQLAARLLGSGHDDAPQVANVRNAGTFDFLPDDAVIEVPAFVDADGARPLPLGAPLPPLMRGLVAHVSAYEELAIDAALRGGTRRVRTALLAHPLVGQADVAAELADALVAANTRYLPWAGGR
jgi:6-phospho-beta-glucosidase